MSDSSSKELALTTLVDLFVQILFVFVMILAARANGTGAEGGFEIDKPWQRLVEMLGVLGRDQNLVADAAIKRMEVLEKEKEVLEKENKDLLDKLNEFPKSAPHDGRAPGKPRCKAGGRILVPVVNVTLKTDATIVVMPDKGWRVIARQSRIDDNRMFGFRLTASQFSESFLAVYTLSEQLDCRYTAIIKFDRNIAGEVLDRNSSLVQKYFYRAGS